MTTKSKSIDRLDDLDAIEDMNDTYLKKAEAKSIDTEMEKALRRIQKIAGFTERDEAMIRVGFDAGRAAAKSEAPAPDALADALQAVYDSERNVHISCFWDSGWTVKFGDEANGFTKIVYCDKVHEITEVINAWNKRS